MFFGIEVAEKIFLPVFFVRKKETGRKIIVRRLSHKKINFSF